MNCQILFSGKKRKLFQICYLKFLPSMLSQCLHQIIFEKIQQQQKNENRIHLTLKAPITTIVVCFVFCWLL